MRARVVEHDHGPGPELRHGHCFDVEQERLAVDRAGQVQGRQRTRQTQRAGMRLTVVAPVARGRGKGARARADCGRGCASSPDGSRSHQGRPGHGRPPPPTVRATRRASSLPPLALAPVGLAWRTAPLRLGRLTARCSPQSVPRSAGGYSFLPPKPAGSAHANLPSTLSPGHQLASSCRASSTEDGSKSKDGLTNAAQNNEHHHELAATDVCVFGLGTMAGNLRRSPCSRQGSAW